MHTGRLVGRVAVVTGASRGLGTAIAETFAHHGARVAVVARTAEPDGSGGGSLGETVDRIRAAGGEATAFTADLVQMDGLDALVGEVHDTLGKPTILVNSAAVTFLRPLEDLPVRRAQVMLNLHLLVPLRLVQLLAPGMREAGGGWVLNLTSIAARQPEGPPFDAFSTAAGFGMYGTVKAALNRLTVSLAAELYDDGIAVNAAGLTDPVATPGAAALDLAQEATEDVALICRTALELVDGDRSVLTGQVVETQPFLAALDRGEVAGAATGVSS